MAGEAEEITVIAGQMKESATANSGTRLVFSNGTVLHQNVPAGGSSHYAVNEGPKPDLMILIEIKGTGSERNELLSDVATVGPLLIADIAEAIVMYALDFDAFDLAH